ncbi:unnamed protein product, partial [Nesidiocoris tenuis]
MSLKKPKSSEFFGFSSFANKTIGALTLKPLVFGAGCSEGISQQNIKLEPAEEGKPSCMFWMTNETVNIWSHIFGWMLFLGLTLYDLCLLNIHASFTDKFIVGLLLACFQ